MYLSKNIKFLRKNLKLSQTELGKRVQKTKEVISAYERGVTTPPLDVVIDLCRLFGLPLDDLVFRDLAKEGASEKPLREMEKLPATSSSPDINRLMAQRIKELEREIRRHNPGLADELGIG
ncbi:helix-turn-helix transcriptional regulator [Flavilitoribacter nigricans]|uniref:HTH cro/C1-type domain-containing protein n=1 Tax=Flavilitoribacter nigricans (strain ATCC 23147 / DSM 23189 / NBRC 102662 / NCIMB 1420 / SS-2) TaxID=1122177 RepID=A0A2D0MY29_FLAN2|nr:helix-turn-helix transcriptional regulator [Flavilitoribacter nigricans]PHN00799.1 hypothetical protein CRP01_40370 [Flavilitoribacter nigricans DSM 23189 = NBRC 102662]